MKKIKIIIGVILIIISVILASYIGVKEYNNYKEKKKYEEEKANFKVEIILNDKQTISFGEEVNLKDYIKESNVTFEDKKVTFYEFGEQEVILDYIDKYDRKGVYKFYLEVVDDVAPILLSPSTVTIVKGKKDTTLDGVVCADFVSSNVKCEVEGDYNLNKVGEYNINYKATDEKGNVTTKEATLNVVSKQPDQTSPNYVDFKDIYNEHKKDNTLIGIDVSRWQGSINFNKVKEAGAEFVIIRLGTYYNGKHNLDTRYEENIKKAKEAGLKVGLYYYSEAKTIEEAISCADYIKNNLHYDIDLPIAYDWEDWSNFNSYKVSLYDFNNSLYAFLDKIEEYGYDSMIYGSTKYLTNIWRPKSYKVWVAQYYKEVTYEGKYMMWQLTSSAKIDGISGVVDVDILYID